MIFTTTTTTTLPLAILQEKHSPSLVRNIYLYRVQYNIHARFKNVIPRCAFCHCVAVALNMQNAMVNWSSRVCNKFDRFLLQRIGSPLVQIAHAGQLECENQIFAQEYLYCMVFSQYKCGFSRGRRRVTKRVKNNVLRCGSFMRERNILTIIFGRIDDDKCLYVFVNEYIQSQRNGI